MLIKDQFQRVEWSSLFALRITEDGRIENLSEALLGKKKSQIVVQ